MAFFSSTDIKELEENAKRHYLYLSIVVNNNNKIIAKVVQAVYGEKIIKRFITNGLGKKEQLNDVIEEINDIREWNLKVVFEESTVDDEFAEAVESIILEKEEKEKQALYKKLKNTYQPNLFDHYYPKNSFEEDIIKENSIEEKIDNILCELFGSFDDDFYNLLDGFSKDNTKNSKSLSKVFSNNYKRVIWKYKLLLNCGEEDLKDIVFDTLWEYKADYEFLEDIINNFYELTNDRTK